MLKNCTELWDGIKEKIELITSSKVIKYGKEFMNL